MSLFHSEIKIHNLYSKNVEIAYFLFNIMIISFYARVCHILQVEHNIQKSPIQ